MIQVKYLNIIKGTFNSVLKEINRNHQQRKSAFNISGRPLDRRGLLPAVVKSSAWFSSLPTYFRVFLHKLSILWISVSKVHCSAGQLFFAPSERNQINPPLDYNLFKLTLRNFPVLFVRHDTVGVALACLLHVCSPQTECNAHQICTTKDSFLFQLELRVRHTRVVWNASTKRLITRLSNDLNLNGILDKPTSFQIEFGLLRESN